MTVCSFEQLKTKVFPWRGSGLFRRGRGKVCQNRGGGITGAREKKRTRRDIDLSRQTFVGFSTKNRGSTRYLLKISPRRVQKSRVSGIGGSRAARLSTNRKRSRDRFSQAKFHTKAKKIIDPISTIFAMTSPSTMEYFHRARCRFALIRETLPESRFESRSI